MPALCFRVNAEYAQIAEVAEGLFICGITSLNADNIRNYRISLIVNATSEVPNARCLGNVHRIKLWLEDTPEADLYSHLNMQCDQIQEVLSQGGRVLVHCVAGVSRSASICLAYLIKYRGMSLHEAYMHMAARRPLVRPNLGFWRQLISFEQEIRGKEASVRIVRYNDQLLPDVYVSTKEYSKYAYRKRPFLPVLEPLAEVVQSVA